MLVDVNELFLVELKKSNILTFYVQPKNKHYRDLDFITNWT